MTAETDHPVVAPFQPPDRDIKIWRYMNLPQLINFLETESLHFARADTLGDPYEGSWTRLNKAVEKRQFQQWIADLERTNPDAKGKNTPEQLQQMAENTTHLGRESIYINCWHVGETESAAMWKLYGTAAGSIVIQSTYKKLADAFPDDAYMGDVSVGKVYMGLVQYKDYNSFEDWIPGGNIMYPFIHKRKEFEYEKEVRALIFTMEGFSKRREGTRGYKPQGTAVGIDIDKVVETIRVEPTTPAWVRESIEKLLERYGWGMKVMPSQIDINPMY